MAPREPDSSGGEAEPPPLAVLTAAVAQAAESLYVTDRDGRIVYVNPMFERLTGYTAAEALGQTPRILRSGKHSRAFYEDYWRTILTGHVWRGTIVNRRKDGRLYVEEHTVAPVRDERGEITSFVCIGQDVTERERARRSRHLLDRLVGAIGDADDLDSALAMVLREVCETTGWNYAEAWMPRAGGETIECSPIWYGNLPNIEAFRAMTEGQTFGRGEGLPGRVWASGQPEWDRDVSALRRSRFRRTAAARSVGLKAGFGLPLATNGETVAILAFFVREEREEDEELVGIVSSIAAELGELVLRKRAEEAQRERGGAEATSRARAEFLSRMSHELRTPLSVVLGFAQILEMEELSADQAESVGHIIKAGRHLLDLIDEVLLLTRLEGDRLPLSIEPVLLKEVLEEVVELMRPLAAQRQVWIGTEAGDCPPYVLADRQRLKQVLLNLLSNGIKYNRSGGRLTVLCRPAGADTTRVEVIDSGIGIPAEKTVLVFQPFERLGAEATGVEGTGLGLALCKRLIEAMHGQIGLESTVGSGTTVWFELPLGKDEESTDQARTAAPGAAPAPAGAATTQSVLYIEDNLANLRLVERALSRHPWIRLVAAMQGRMGLEIARNTNPALIIVDLQLPDMTGEAVINALKSDEATRGIPIVVASADATARQIERMYAAGVRAYVTKPLDIRKFVQMVEEILTGESPRDDPSRD